jgi:hypothetical protein
LHFGLRDYDDMDLVQLTRWHAEAVSVLEAVSPKNGD